MTEVKFLDEALPFEEQITLDKWKHRHVDIKTYFDYYKKTVINYEDLWATMVKELEWFRP